nr:DNA excision repair protein ERCC-6-like [Onthophagus taurus]
MEHLPPLQTSNAVSTPVEFELVGLQQIENIKVWGDEHENLEGQALKELKIFQDIEHRDEEEGEIKDNENVAKVSGGFLDINQYLKSQEDLKKKFERKKTLIDEKRNNKIIFKEHKRKKRKFTKESVEKACENESKKEKNEDSDSDYIPSDDDLPEKEYNRGITECVKRKRKTGLVDKVIDDGNLSYYKHRLNEYYKKLEEKNCKEGLEFTKISKHLKMLKKTWDNLYSYQRKGVEWLWRLHKQSHGGLLGDEMGLGKTVQVIAFFSALSNNSFVSNYCRYTGLGPVIIVCPTTVIYQWVQHFHDWAPEIRVAILHTTGSFIGSKSVLIKDIFKAKGVLVTSYFGMLQLHKELVNFDWHYIVLDEGHKIRNSQAKITLAVKKFQTPHKLILTGSPMQNNLQELWSLFDFICPSMLGSLQVFNEHFVTPIIQGGYTNATYEQETTALAMATTLKDMISPYLLRRCKNDLKEDIHLPQKREQVLFCSLSNEQRELYKEFLKSSHVEVILGKNNNNKNWFSEQHTRAQVLVGITMLRKVCNHPRTYLDELDETKMNLDTDQEENEKNIDYKRSGKMIVVSALLKMWKKQSHRVLLFTQSRSMIKIFESFLVSEGYCYLKMDGSTSVTSRQGLINKFNQDNSFDVFLLTTRVGGLGVNLTGADRVIIYDPDWNPATDTQARERAWRIGQDKQVTIYRLISAGTIEEKIYQRQVWKQLLSNKVLLDPKSQKFFTTSDLHDLFSLQEPNSNDSETGNIFKKARVSVQEKLEKQKQIKETKTKKITEKITFTEDKIEQMKRKAQEIAKNIASKSENDLRNKKKFAYEFEEEMERKHKEAERNFMKKLSPQELMEYNRKKLNENVDSSVNKLDDFKTGASFSQALEICEKTSTIYHRMREEKLDMDKAQDIYEGFTKKIIKQPDILKRKNKKNCIDVSGRVDGEKIENLIKIESRKLTEEENNFNDNQDDYVLGKLFSKKGVQSALQHDIIVESNIKERKNRFSAFTEAQNKTEIALQALRKSRLRDWRW